MSLLELLVVETGLGLTEIRQIAYTAPRRYKQYTIPKRDGGSRPIAQPARELKLLQRVILENVLTSFPVHHAATAYAVGRSIKKNAIRHVENRSLMKLDFRSFFPSLLVRDWVRYLERQSPDTLRRANLAEPDDRRLSSRLLFWGSGTLTPKCLSIGAPTSPSISNILMFEIDEAIAEICRVNQVTYTRYADDITLSASHTSKLILVEKAVREVIRNSGSPKLIFNDEKRGVFTRGQKRMVTGLILTPDNRVSIGRERKRAIKALLDKFGRGLLQEADGAHLKGLLGFAAAAEPDFLTRLRRKYGSEVLDRALRQPLFRRSTTVALK